jgi:hydrogenase expression/formation protein HypD
MRPLDAFHDRELVRGLAAHLHRLLAGCDRRLTFMEVCGTHTMANRQHGLRTLLPPPIRLLSGPGCPVCVTPNSYLDRAIACARLPETIVATFGDLVRVPGSTSSLLEERARGRDVRVVYSPLDAVALAAKNRGRRVIFLGIGFETTAPAVAGSILAAAAQGLDNYFVLAAPRTILPPMRTLADDPELGLAGYICPAHVSAVIGADAYRPLAAECGIPCVVTGFEPADVLRGIEMLVRQALAGRSAVENEYSRVVKPAGNRQAQAILAEVFVTGAAEWRGLGLLADSGLQIAPRYARFDAERQLPVTVEATREPPGCRCGEILQGKIEPAACPLFATVCTPEAPVGACMVSSEGTCAAAFKYDSRPA